MFYISVMRGWTGGRGRGYGGGGCGIGGGGCGIGGGGGGKRGVEEAGSRDRGGGEPGKIGAGK